MDDDDDDDDFDESLYDVGTIYEPAAAAASEPSPPPPAPMPREGSVVQAVYSRRWQPATVVSGDPDTRTLRVRFVGYSDVVTLPQECWTDTGSSAASPREGRESNRKRARDTDEDYEGGGDMSAAERSEIERCLSTRQASSDDQAPVPGAALDDSSIGHKLLRKMGWKPGEGLGAAGEGRVRLVADDLHAQVGRSGLQTSHEQPQRKAPAWTRGGARGGRGS